MSKYFVVITLENEKGKYEQKTFKTDSIIGVSRLITTFKVKKGSKIVLINIDLIETLV